MFVLGEEERGALHNKIDSQESSSKVKVSSEISVPFCKISLHSWTAKWKLCDPREKFEAEEDQS
jgi:hypothetical protein